MNQIVNKKMLRSSNPLKFYSDPGHGWLAVKKEDVELLNLEISPFSYQKGKTVYLEEDCDASKFLDAYFKYTEIDPQSYKCDERSCNGSSPIRGYEKYSK